MLLSMGGNLEGRQRKTRKALAGAGFMEEGLILATENNVTLKTDNWRQ
ncbi:hypothetical protein [Jejubacter calystegiae]|nr:hypothetical protein [Jejubacter calystegiae]